MDLKLYDYEPERYFGVESLPKEKKATINIAQMMKYVYHKFDRIHMWFYKFSDFDILRDFQNTAKYVL